MLSIVLGEDCPAHDAGPHHPEAPGRLDAIRNQLISSGLDFVARIHDAPEATREQLLRVHEAAHLDRIDAAIPAQGHRALDGDTVLSPGSGRAALQAAGAGILGVDLLMGGAFAPVFCPVRPPGHHATRDAAMGFCLYSNVALAARHALEAHGLARVAIVDFDAHHGNGTEDAVAGDGRILLLSSFQHPFYPFSGTEERAENLLPVPLSAGTGGEDFRRACAEAWCARLAAFAPELVLFSAGFDGHAADEMSALMLVEADFAWITAEVRRITRAATADRYLSVLEGGYETGSLARSVVAHLKVLID